MNGIVSLLDDHHYQLVENLWAELEREFSVRGVYVTPYPHFSYQVAAQYNVEQLEPILSNIAENSTPFHVVCGGLGIFTGPHPVLYIPVVRSQQLNQFHQQVWSATLETGSDAQDYYHPDYWMPHITIGFADINRDNIGSMLQFLSERNFNWDIPINNIAFIHDDGTRQVLRSRFDFRK
ncbi:MAG TPA: 2'-5' RNA ligase family protein [Ktedonobacteraceae bacterium]|nr:2'-5' RNA ligase family protein [Ktedonobacteraceae bacterium]